MLVEVLVLELVRLLLEEWADGEGDGREVVQPGAQVRLATGRPAGPLVLPVKAASPADGILGYQFDKRKDSSLLLHAIHNISTGGYLKRKPDFNLVLQIYIKKISETRKLGSINEYYLVMRVENQTKTRVWEDSSLCLETSSKNVVQEFHLCRSKTNFETKKRPREKRNQCCGSMTFWGGSGSADPCLWLMDPDPDPGSGSGSCYFRHWPARCQQKTNFLTQFFLLITFRSYIYIIFQR